MNQTYSTSSQVSPKKSEFTTRKNVRQYMLTVLILLSSLLNSRAQTLIAGWDFQTTTTGGTAAAVSPATPKVYQANFGSGTIYFDGTNTSSSWFVPATGSTNTELNSFGGTAINAGSGFSTVTSGASSLALVGGLTNAANGKFAVFKLNMTGMINLTISYASQRSGTGFTAQIWEYSADGVNWFPIQTITTIPAAYATISLPVVTGLNGVANAFVRLSGTGATASTGNNRLDNIQFNATPGLSLTTGTISGSPFCITNDTGTIANVPFTLGGTPNPGNIYTAQLSNASGSFATPVNIGTLSSVASTGTISAIIPAGTPSGTGYRIRVICSDPSSIGTDNGVNLTIDKVVATASNSGPVCAGLSVTFNAGGGTGYSWTGPNGFSSLLQNPVINPTVVADSGDYLVTVTSALGCTDTASTLGYIQNCGCVPPVPSAVSTPPSCNGGGNGSIDLSVTGGVSPYTFVWSTGAVTEDISGVSAGTYTVIVTDNILCKDTFEVTVGEPTAIVSSFAVGQPGCQGFSNGSIDLTVSGGTPGYTYLWGNGAVTEDITGLVAGLYSVTITDANGCVYNDFAVVTDPGAFTATAIGFDVTCAGLNNGVIDLVASNDTSSFNPGVLISEFLANPAGTDSSKEWVELIATKNIDFAVTPYTVIVANNGTATTKGWVQGGVASATTNGTYAFEISTGSVVAGEVFYVGGSNMNVTGRKLRTIDVSTTGGDGGIGTATTGGILGNGTTNADGIAVFNLPVASLDSNTVPVDAIFYGSGIGTAVVNGGADGFTLPVNDNYSGGRLQSTSFKAVDPGALSVQAIGSFNKLNGTYSPIRTWATDTIVTGGYSSVALLTGNTYLWSNGAVTEDLNGLSAGTYTVTVTSPTGCTATASATINAPVALVVTEQIFDVTCFGLSDGSIDLTVSGGTAPYSYLWNDADVNEDRSGLPTGLYSVVVTDANGCTFIGSYQVNQPNDISYTTIVTHPSCFGASDGAIDLTISGGTAPYSVDWSNGDLTEDIINQPANFYFFNIMDANGCVSGGLEFINDPAQIIITGFTPNTGGSGVQVTINGSGFTGATDVKFNTTSATGFTVISDFQINAIVPLGATDGFISVYTSPTCFSTSVDTFFYNPVACVPPTLSATFVSPTCPGALDGSVDLTITGGVTPYTISWSNGANSEDLAGISAGVYTVIVSDAAVCPDTLQVTVTEPTAISLTAIIDSVGCNGGANGSIDLSVSGGTAPYTYLWSNAAVTEDLSGLSVGNYTVLVLDANNCAAAGSYDVFEPAVLTVSLAGVDPNCAGEASGSVTSIVTGGTAQYNYSWSNGATTSNLNGVLAGSYVLTVTDTNGCTVSDSIVLIDPAPFTLSLVSSTDPTCFGSATGAIDIAASNDPLVPPTNPGLLISEFLADPSGTDNPFEWVELVATKPIDFSVTPYTVVFTNNGVATTKGWRAGGILSYAFQISSGVVNPGDVFYVGGSSMAPTGTKLRVIATNTTAGDGFGNVNAGLGNGGANADAIGVFPVASALIDSTTVPVDAIIFGSGTGAAIVNAGTAGYTLPVNDLYNGGLLDSTSFRGPNSVSGSSFRATGAFDIGSGIYTARTWALNTTFTDGTTAIAVTQSNSYSWSNGATTQDLSGITAGTYTVTATNSAGCTAALSVTLNQPNDLTVSGFTPISGNVGTIVTISGAGFAGADQVLFNGTSATFVVDNDGQITTSVPAGATTGSITIINDGCDTVVTGVPFTISTNVTLNLTMLIEGMYDGAGGLVPALLNSGVGVSSTECDTILVEVRDQVSTTTVLASGTAVLGTNGQASFTFPASLSGATGYIAVFHRNAVQTWSDLVTFSGTTNYDFTTAATQAYFGNQKEVSIGVWAFYSGDIAPQDEVVDIFDVIPMDNDVINFAFGYTSTDLTGDGVVDIFDVIVLDNNVINFVASIHP
ncbi:MAG: hypothetical protein KBB64_08715 [Bacteroidia bacterium]|nr:hypothetical protein [Bacteroidia bacterium]